MDCNYNKKITMKIVYLQDIFWSFLQGFFFLYEWDIIILSLVPLFTFQR